MDRGYHSDDAIGSHGEQPLHRAQQLPFGMTMWLRAMPRWLHSTSSDDQLTGRQREKSGYVLGHDGFQPYIDVASLSQTRDVALTWSQEVPHATITPLIPA